MKMFSKGMLMVALITGIFGCASAYAAEEVQEFSLDPMVVTAERIEKNELDIPSSVEVITAEQLEKTGGNNLQEALKFATGIITHAQGTKGTPQGTMSSKIIIRGVEKGTLVLVDGVPINQNGRYDLGNISTDLVEKVEIVRGGGSVLYGSEASGGVINVITKKKRNNAIKTAWGNYQQQNHGVSVQAGPVGITYDYEKSGKMYDISDPAGGRPVGNSYSILRSEHNNFNVRYNINDKLTFSNTYSHNSSVFQYRYLPQNKAINKDVKHSFKTNMSQLRYEDDSFKAILSFNRRDQNSVSKARNSKKVGKETQYLDTMKSIEDKGFDEKTLGLDIQKNWKLKDDKAIIGLTYQNDKCDYNNQLFDIAKKKYTTDYNNDYKRNMFSVYGQYDHAFGKAANLIISARETFTSSTKANNVSGESYSKFTPEAQYIYKFDEDTTAYAKAGLSFMMPTFTQMFGSGETVVGNANLKPQQGRHFEIGMKKNIKNQAWRLAAFNYTIEDSIEAKLDSEWVTTYANEDIKNTGLELSCATDMGKGWSSNLGVTWSHPQKQGSTTDGSGKVTKGAWHDYYGKFQLNGGLSYSREKVSGAINFTYLGKRVRDVDDTPKMRPYLMSNFNFSYKPDKNNRFYVNVDNLFNRKDITSSSSSSFYALGRNFMMGYEMSF